MYGKMPGAKTHNKAARISGPTGRRHQSTFVTRRLSFLYPEEERANHMAVLDWSQCPAVESVPGRVSGAWVFRGTRMPVSVVFENLEDGITIDELVELYDGLTRDQVIAVLDFAARSLDEPALAP